MLDVDADAQCRCTMQMHDADAHTATRISINYIICSCVMHFCTCISIAHQAQGILLRYGRQLIQLMRKIRNKEIRSLKTTD
jgi:hypothetical protein